MIEYKGKQYKTREIFVDKNVGHVTIAELALSDAMSPMIGKEAKAIDDTIAYYANPEEWKLSDQELRDSIYGPPKNKKKK